MNILRCTLTPVLPLPPASGRQIITPPESCLSIPHINFSYDPNSSFLAIKFRKTLVDLKTSGMLDYHKVAFGHW